MAKQYLKMDSEHKNQTDAQIIREALDDNSYFFKCNISNINTAIQMRNFLYVDGGQWSAADVSDRGLRAKTSQTLNVTEPIVRKLISEERASDPQCIVVPMDDKIPTEIIKVKTGVHEGIIYESNAKMVYAKCYADMLEAGYGQINICARPESSTSFNNVLRYESPEDVLYSYWDPTDTHPNKITGDYAGNYFFMPKKNVMLTYNVDYVQSIELPNYWGVNFYSVLREDVIVLLNHYRKCYGKITMVRLQDGAEMPLKIYNEVKKEIIKKYEEELLAYSSLVEHKKIEAAAKGFSEKEIELMILLIPKPEEPEIPAIQKRKECTDFYYEHLVLSKDKVLKREILPIQKIPQLYVGGNDKKFFGVTICQPYAANAVTPQRLINYITSEQIDNIGRSFGFRVIAHQDAVEENESNYKRPSVSNLLKFKSLESGEIIPPKFEYVSGVDMGLMQVLEEQMQNVKSVLGRYNENLGDESNAYGYEAILARQLNGDISSGIWPENLNNAIAEAAKICFKWMPFVYDTERSILTKNKDGEPRFVTINRPTGDEDDLGNLILENDMRKGEFSIEVYGGLSFATQRLAGMQFLEKMMMNDETLKKDLIDIYLSLSPFSFKNEAIRRLKETGYINPEVIAAEEGEPLPKPKPNPLQELAHLKMIAEIKQLQSQEFKSKMDAITSIVKLKSDIAKMEGDKAKAEMQLIDDTVESYAKIIEADAQTQNDTIMDAANMIEQMLTGEINELKSENAKDDNKEI